MCTGTGGLPWLFAPLCHLLNEVRHDAFFLLLKRSFPQLQPERQLIHRLMLLYVTLGVAKTAVFLIFRLKQVDKPIFHTSWTCQMCQFIHCLSENSGEH